MSARFFEIRSVEGQPVQDQPAGASAGGASIAASASGPAAPYRADEGVMATLRQGRVRQNLSLLSLSALLGAQCLLPALAVAGDATAAQRREEARQIQRKQDERQSAKREAQEAEKRSKAQPVPGWYKRLHEGEQARLRQMRAAKVLPVAASVAAAPVRLAQLPSAAQAPAGQSMPAGGSFQQGETTVDAFETLPKLPARAMVTTVALAQMVSRSRMPWNRPRAAKPGVIMPSAPLYVPNPLTTTKKMDLSGKRVPEQLEISRRGRCAGRWLPRPPPTPRRWPSSCTRSCRRQALPRV